MTPTASYVAGKIDLTAGVVGNLLDMIRDPINGINPNCPGSATEFTLRADPANAGAIAVGAASPVGGPLSATNYAYLLTATSPPRIYRSTYPGNSTPLGDLQVLASSAAILHVEVQA